MSVPFVHLRVHSEFSLVDGLVRIKPLAKALAGMNMPAVAITDQSNMCSLVKFYKTAMGAGIKPICGADLWLAGADPEAPLSRICFLAMDAKGYRNLTELISRGWTDGQRNGLVILQREWIAPASEGLIALSAGKEGDIGMALLSGRDEEAQALLQD
ncbi:MAG: PHP domain-containing protein, partial [Pseudomonas putida]